MHAFLVDSVSLCCRWKEGIVRAWFERGEDASWECTLRPTREEGFRVGVVCPLDGFERMIIYFSLYLDLGNRMFILIAKERTPKSESEEGESECDFIFVLRSKDKKKDSG